MTEELEKYIDRYGLVDVLSEISDICHMKSQHLREYWRNKSQAALWTSAGISIYKLSRRLLNKDKIVFAKEKIYRSKIIPRNEE